MRSRRACGVPGVWSVQDKRMISVLRALVTYLKVKEKRPEKDEEDQVRRPLVDHWQTTGGESTGVPQVQRRTRRTR